MKRFLLIASILCVSLFALVGCGERKDPPADGNVYDTLNTLVKKDAGKVSLTVTTKSGGETLTSTYLAETTEKGILVTYSLESLNEIVEGENGYTLPETAKSVKTGSMLVKDGKIVEQDGAAADVTVQSVTASGLTFAETSFEDVETESGKFSAKVAAPAAFLGQTITCTDMTVSVEYGSDALEKIEISYVAGGNITLLYSFG